MVMTGLGGIAHRILYLLEAVLSKFMVLLGFRVSQAGLEVSVFLWRLVYLQDHRSRSFSSLSFPSIYFPSYFIPDQFSSRYSRMDFAGGLGAGMAIVSDSESDSSKVRTHTHLGRSCAFRHSLHSLQFGLAVGAFFDVDPSSPLEFVGFSWMLACFQLFSFPQEFE